jgi:hypothetical protein
MGPVNPYAPPSGPRPGALGQEVDVTELYVQTLPTPLLRGAMMVHLVFFFLFLLLAFRLRISLRQNDNAVLLEVAHLAAALASGAVARGLQRGASWALVVGFLQSPVAFAASLFALFTGSVAGFMGLIMAALNVVLLALNVSTVRRIGAARAAIVHAALK